MPANAAIARFHRSLHTWYGKNGRTHLPWRNTADPYAIYISEIMLQQTQVKTVLERFYHPFLKRFPTLSALAKASRDDVLSAWQGLGYYSRAANLHEAAKRCGKALPHSASALMELPGIGRNTAHAIAAFAHREPVPVMEANVKRVLCRIFALEQPKDDELWEKAQTLLDAKNPFDYNQAMMDIGSLVCTRTNPKCGECPASSMCKGQDSPERYPNKLAAKKVPVRRKHIVLFKNGSGEYYASPRTTRFLTGLYHFVEVTEQDRAASLKSRRYPLEKARPLGYIRQQYSHFTLEGNVWLIDGVKDRGQHWHPKDKLARLPFSMAEQKILALLESHAAGSH